MYKVFRIIFIKLSIQTILQNGIYNLNYKNLIFNYENQTIQITYNLKEEINSNFRIKEISNNKNISFYYIEHINTNLNLIYSINNTENLLFDIIYGKEDLALWKFIEIDNNNYKIKNKNGCYLKVKKFKIKCENITLNEASTFSLVKIYEELIDNINYELIQKEPVDALIKYIDLRDPSLERKGIHQIKKDYDNEELRYCIRSILKNIPWIRKIFIIMPNKKVRFFKDYDFIKNKIIYVNDKDILGFDSSNSLAFQFRYWRMKKFGISNNFISMDDDYFIGHPLNKTDFFYVLNGQVTPLIITHKFTKLDKISTQKKMIEYKNMINKFDEEQTSPIFRYSLYLTYSYIIKLFKEPLFIPVHTHNAIPINLKELKEIYDIIYQSENRFGTLYSLYRPIDNIQFQTFVVSYTFFKYNKKVRNISNKLINNKNSIIADYNYSLFCINTGSIDYNNISFMETKIVMEYLFHIISPYEIIDNKSSLSNLAFNTIYSIEMEYMQLKVKKTKKINNLQIKLEKYKIIIKHLYYIPILYLLIIKIFFIIIIKLNYNIKSIEKIFIQK